MIIKDYIASGILEKYVLGLTTEAENSEVQNYIENFPEVKVEFDAIQNALNEYAMKYQKTPPLFLKSQILSAIKTSNNSNIFSKNTAPAKIITLEKTSETLSLQKWQVAASILFLAASSILNIYFYNKYQSTRVELTALAKEKDFLATEFKIQETVLEKTKGDFLFLSQPVTKSIILKGVPNFAESLATVYWNNETKEVYLIANYLPTIAADKQYQLWAIVDGKPHDAGVFDIENNKGSIQKMKMFSNPQAFAITLENKGGSTVPHLDALHVIGNV